MIWCLKLIAARKHCVADELPKTTMWNIIKHNGEIENILGNKGKSSYRPKLVSDIYKRILVKLK